MAKKTDDSKKEAKVTVPDAPKDDASTADNETQSLSDLSADELSAMEVIVEYFLPEGTNYKDALKHVGRFGVGDDAEWRFIPPDDWAPSTKAETEEGSTSEEDNETDTPDAPTTEATTAPAPKVKMKTVRSPVPSKSTGPVRKTYSEMTDDEFDRKFDDIINKASTDSALA